MLIPEPLGGLDCAFDAANAVRGHGFALLLAIHASELLSEAAPDNNDVSLAKLDPLGLCDFLNVGDGDSVCIEAVELDVVLVNILAVVNEHASGDQTSAVMPVVQSGKAARLVFVSKALSELLCICLDPVVASLGRLVVEMACPWL